jgi:hypothetical protein
MSLGKTIILRTLPRRDTSFTISNLTPVIPASTYLSELIIIPGAIQYHWCTPSVLVSSRRAFALVERRDLTNLSEHVSASLSILHVSTPPRSPNSSHFGIASIVVNFDFRTSGSKFASILLYVLLANITSYSSLSCSSVS